MDNVILVNNNSSDPDFADFLIGLSENRSLIFDLDNTIYNEKEFLFQAYKDISKRLTEEYGCMEEDVFRFLSNTFISSGRNQIFNKLQLQFQIKGNKFINTCLEVLRSTIVFPYIEPYPYFSKFIRERKKNSTVFIITNGNPDQQKNKVKSINWGISLPKQVVYANLYLSKPSPESFICLKKEHNLKRPIYIGDSPGDFLFAKNCGMDFIEVFKREVHNYSIA